ncbi:MAG: UvrB/UvrC motif-containing protein, partial [Planctomycetota bacterium]|nr:UvrB/UvrC motif-containing protein [Planctomycetota bacterium]
LIEVREDIRERYEVGETLKEKLVKAVAEEQYELAAQLRDELERREIGPR